MKKRLNRVWAQSLVVLAVFCLINASIIYFPRLASAQERFSRVKAIPESNGPEQIETNLLSESFDAAASLPAGWSSVSLSGANAWVTNTASFFSAPRSAQGPGNFASASDTVLVSPASSVPANTPTTLTFRLSIAMDEVDAQTAKDVAVLEIHVGSNNWQDIESLAGTPVTGTGYNHATTNGAGNPLNGRRGWSGSGIGNALMTYNIPSFPTAQNVAFRWREGTDSTTFAGATTGIFVDNVSFDTVTANLVVDRIDDFAAANACTVAAGDCSLRGAISRANLTAGATTQIIELPAGQFFSLNIANAGNLQENANLTGDLDIDQSQHPVIINGNGSTISCGLNGGTTRERVLQITTSNSANSVELNNLSIVNGIAVDDGVTGSTTVLASANTTAQGGGILNGGGPLVLNNVTLNSNQAQGGAAPGGQNNGPGRTARGGSLYSGGGAIVLNNSTISTSRALGGTGSDNSLSGGSNGGGGGDALGSGIYIGGGSLSVNATTIDDADAIGGTGGTGGNSGGLGGAGNGGGIYTLAPAIVTNSTISNSDAKGGVGGSALGTTTLGGHGGGSGGIGQGGAIYLGGPTTLTLDSSTLTSNNSTGGVGGPGGRTDGGGGTHGNGGNGEGGSLSSVGGATMTITHSTMSANSASGGAAGTAGQGSAAAGVGGNGSGGSLKVNAPTTVNISNTIVDGDSLNGVSNTGVNISGAINSQGHNLVGTSLGVTGLSGTDLNSPSNLGPLQFNGGPTKTRAPNAGSAAIDTGVRAGTPADQRGAGRTADQSGVPNTNGSDGTDIGSYEVGATLAAGASVSGQVVAAGGRGLTNGQVTILDTSGGQPKTVITGRNGVFQFDDVEVGRTYIVSVVSRRGSYSPQVVQVFDNVSGLIFQPGR